jgi:ribulose-phosphate 3-epimerase
MIERVKPACDLEVDGGIDAATAHILVAGSAIFGDRDGVAAGMDRLWTSLYLVEQ